MKEYTFGKKASATLIHQVVLVVSVMAAFAADFYRDLRIGHMAGILLAVSGIAILMAFVMIAYLTNAISSFHILDKIGPDVQLALLIILVYAIMSLVIPINPSYSLPDRMVVIGVATYLVDALFLIVYASFVTQIKDGSLLGHCILVRLGKLIGVELFRHTMTTRALRGLLAWGVGITGVFIFVMKKRWIGIIIVLVSAGIELYFSLQKAYELREIRNAIDEITKGNLDQTLDVEKFHGGQRQMAESINHIRDGLTKAVRDGIKNERMKADLITNVSHDLKTPLTSIINYVSILKKEIPESEKAWQHIAIMEEKSHRLKGLLDDLVEVSRLTSGTVKYEMARIDFVELLYEIGGEFDERFESRGLTIVSKLSRLPIYINADGRQLCRAVENLYTNAAKYAKADTHVTVELYEKDEIATFSIKNVVNKIEDVQSISSEELMERFVRGDRSRTTEGSGLGLSITNEIITQMGGCFKVTVEEDVYTASITFKIA